ncbi:histidine ammonia-lyase [Actinoplanes sp. SE50]|uniref:histidine ammonia-lyase n=1 Tax=unclassified Actinoplanes TaxID=2626549 RepID=UPI00023ECC1A|nr:MULTISPECIES: histidine ammonia-lyase [unclassified Actinoplanes]AEV82070.1 histidine ammonia-lyase [Actinoplanes sp. SE50/110]ATO80469.1 histidine ammonia-lyase [Actinoplanes sp. SE50]SLL97876.1 histidine ammonia-lyase [Actinoplanes sp. SE50/110]
MTVIVQPTGIDPADVIAVARHDAKVELSPAAVEAMAASRAIVDGIEASGRPVYGVSTGFGALANTSIAPERRAELQHALIRSHAAGVGAPMPREVVRAMMLLRIRSLAMGRSGVRPVLAQGLADLLNHDITPWVPEHGSLGASGDLAPLAHCAIVLLGEGWVIGKDGARASAAEALHTAGLRPLELAAKEGLALINGTDGMLGMLLLAIADAAHLFTMADVTAALATEAMLGSERPFLPELHSIRPHPGQAASAANIHRLLQDSAIMDSHRDDLAHAVQDAYSIRCAPQVAGAARDTLDFVRVTASRELVSVVDNPVVLPDGRVESTGNFHGAPLGFAADFLAIAAAEVGAIAERRVDRLLDVTRSRELPPFLSPDAGVNSGLMIAQYTAAGIVAENRRLAGPASVDSLPTSGMQEDHVSMGWAATKKLRTVLDNLTSLLAVELLSAVRGLQLRAPITPSPAGRAAIAAVEPFAGRPGPDVFLAPVLEQTRAVIAARDLRTAIETATGPLG